ncbi:hypothetical protein Pelo_3177 [Pelomyxa schiedti]|nr:hypothetical protein Pelo_3177 [Pelomyxa schiedti]
MMPAALQGGPEYQPAAFAWMTWEQKLAYLEYLQCLEYLEYLVQTEERRQQQQQLLLQGQISQEENQSELNANKFDSQGVDIQPQDATSRGNVITNAATTNLLGSRFAGNTLFVEEYTTTAAPSSQPPVDIPGQIPALQPPITFPQSDEQFTHIWQPPPNSPSQLQTEALIPQQIQTQTPPSPLSQVMVQSRAEQYSNPITFRRAEENLIEPMLSSSTPSITSLDHNHQRRDRSAAPPGTINYQHCSNDASPHKPSSHQTSQPASKPLRSSRDRNSRKYGDASNSGVHHGNGPDVTLPSAPIGELSLSTYKIFKHQKFSLILKIHVESKRQMNLSTDDILLAALNAKCYKEGTGEELESCKQCSPTKKILSIGIRGQAPFQSTTLPNGMEHFVFDDCMSSCSSSRDHLQTALYLVVELSPGSLVRSPPFVLQARARQSRPTAPRPQTTMNLNTPATSLHLDSTTPSPPPGSCTITTVLRGSLRYSAHIGTGPCDSSVCSVPSVPKRRCTNTREMSRGGRARSKSPPSATAQVNASHSDDAIGHIVHVLRSFLHPKDVEDIVGHIKYYSRNLDGIIDVQLQNPTVTADAQLRNLETEVHLHTYVKNDAAADAFSALLRDYINNDNNVNNLVGKSLAQHLTIMSESRSLLRQAP